MGPPFLHIFDRPLTYQSLRKRLDIVLKKPVPSHVAVEIVTACRMLEAKKNLGLHGTHSDSVIRQLKVLNHPNVVVDAALMRALLSVGPIPALVTCLDYYTENKVRTNSIKQLQELQELLVRRCIFAKDYSSAMELACDEKALNSWVPLLEKQYKRRQRVFLSVFTGLAATADISGVWFAVPLAIYTTAYGWLTAHRFSQPILDRVRWRPKLSAVYKLARSRQIALIERVLVAHDEFGYNIDTYHLTGLARHNNELIGKEHDQHRDQDIRLNKQQNEHNKHTDDSEYLQNFSETLKSNMEPSKPRESLVIGNRNVIPILSESQVMYNEYWATAGDRYVWVEPDQDPTDIYIVSQRHK